ncbi:MAG: hypothetical protein JOZ51_18165 [Chloroflexi bacterium]|nr:hypothetical protein [Chloroflexota bacterium]
MLESTCCNPAIGGILERVVAPVVQYINSGFSVIMKYKHVPCMAHNFAHSFVSGMNYVDGTYIVDELRRILRGLPDATLVIDVLHGQITPSSVPSALLTESVRRYQAWLPAHAQRHHVDSSRIHQLELCFAGTGRHFQCVVVVTDDRGRTHTIRLKEWWK